MLGEVTQKRQQVDSLCIRLFNEALLFPWGIPDQPGRHDIFRNGMSDAKFMTCNQFLFYSNWNKARIVDESGVELAKRYVGDNCYVLYQLENFYVELKVYVTANIQFEYTCFEDTDLLEPYLADIDISEFAV